MQTKTGIIYLQKDKFDLYSPYLPNILEFRFVPELIRDFDLVNRALLDNLLKVFVANNKIPASSMIIVVGDNASFSKDFLSTPIVPQNPQIENQPIPSPPPTLEDLQAQANLYIEHVPFEVVAGKTFPLATGVKAFATNQEVFDGIKQVLEKLGFIIEAVIPGFAFGPELSNKPMMDGGMISLILQKLSTMREYNLLMNSSDIIESTLGGEVEEKESPLQVSPDTEKNKKLFILVGISGIALIFLLTGGILYYQFANPPYKAPAAAPPAQVGTSPQPTQGAAAVGNLAAKDLTVQIINASTSATTADSVKAALTPFGFKSIIVLRQDNLGASAGLVTFSSKPNEQVRNMVTAAVKQLAGDVLIQEKSDAVFDVVIILGK